MLVLHTAPAAVVSLAEAKAQLGVTGSDQDAEIAALVAAATARIDGPDGWLQRAIGTQTWDWKLDELPADADWPTRLWLPLPPFHSVTSVSYLDGDGDTQTFSSTGYGFGGVGGQGFLWLKDGIEWPELGDFPEAVTVRFVAGYSAVPAPIKAAILLMTAELYAVRGDGRVVRSEDVPGVHSVTYATGESVGLSGTVKALLQPYRVFA